MSTLLQSYPVFKSGAVLKHSDLNDLVIYLEDQIKSSRRYLDGFGILKGLEVTGISNSVETSLEISPGVAVMPDGQLVEITQSYKFGYTKTASEYSEEDKKISTCFKNGFVELTNETNGIQLTADEKRCVLIWAKPLEKKEDAVGCVRQSDVNEQQTIEIKFLLGELASVPDAGSHCFSTPCLPLLLGEELSGCAYEKPFSRNIEQGLKEIEQAYAHLKTCYPELFCGEDFDNLNWLFKLSATNPFYVFDYLKTLICAYQELTRTAYLKNSFGKPALENCPEILSLGTFKKSCGCRQYWKSAQANSDERAEAVFYAFRMIALTRKENVDFNHIPVRLTPSRSDKFPLSRRAIPFCLDPETFRPKWNQQLTLERLTDSIPHYAVDYCENHLCYTEGCDFVRVEGHIGMELNGALSAIEESRRHLNLPFRVIALEVSESQTEVMPLWKPDFADLECSFQMQRSYFLAAMDLFYNLTPQLDRSFVHAMADLAENATCYQLFDYGSFMKEVAKFVQVISASGLAATVPAHTFTNIFDGLKIIDRCKHARLRQLFMCRFLRCQEGFQPMCGVPKGGTLAILYKRQTVAATPEPVGKEPVRMARPAFSGIVIGDLAIPCCDVDLTRAPVAVFSVSIQQEIDKSGGPKEDLSDQRGRTIVVVTLRNLSLHYDTLEWKIEILDADGNPTDDSANWEDAGCGNKRRSYQWKTQQVALGSAYFSATLTVRKCAKTDEYTENFSVPVPGRALPGDGTPNLGSAVVTKRVERPKKPAPEKPTPEISSDQR